MSDATFRIRRQRPFTQIDNEMISDKRLSIQALGLGVRMLRLNPDYEYSAKHIQSIAGVSRGKLKTLFDELIAAGYLKKEQTHVEHGKFGRNCYEIVDIPEIPPLTENLSTVEPSTAEPSTVKQSTVSISKDNNISPYSHPEGDKCAEEKKVCAWREPRFLRFWEWYRTIYCGADSSRAGERAAAAKAWDKLKPDDATLYKLRAKLEATMRTRQWQDGIGIARASTVLNRIRRGEISLDELPEVTPVMSRNIPPEPVREEDELL